MNTHPNGRRSMSGFFRSGWVSLWFWVLGLPAFGQSVAAPQLQDSAGLTLRLVPAGQVQMGTASGAPLVQPEELPRHTVTIETAFYMGATEVTQGQWSAVMQTAPWLTPWYSQRLYVRQGADYPAAWVTYAQATEFCQKLSELEQAVYRLPTEAEWEHACGYGGSGVWSFGDDAAAAAEHGWFRENSVTDMYSLVHRRVAQKAANRLGLYDMHGNMSEWCLDQFSDYPLTAAGRASSAGSAFGVLRGGNWFVTWRQGRTATRDRLLPDHILGSAGFRVVRELPR